MLNCSLPHLGSDLVFFLWYLVMISCFYEAKQTYKTLLGLKAAPANLSFCFSADPNALKLQSFSRYHGNQHPNQYLNASGFLCLFVVVFLRRKEFHASAASKRAHETDKE